jgi:hypothetical protein
MSAFLSKLLFEDDGGLPFTLIHPLGYLSDRLNAPVIVPAGFKTDLASIPRPLWAVLPPVGKYDAAAVVHFLYQQPQGAPHVNRADADAVLNEAMEACGVGRVARWTIYAGVRVGGWKIWGAYRKADGK